MPYSLSLALCGPLTGAVELLRPARGLPGLPLASIWRGCGPSWPGDFRSVIGGGDVFGDDSTAGGGARDVADVRPGGSGGVGGSANSAMRQMEDCHADSVARRPPRCKGERTYGFCAKTRAVGHSGLQDSALKNAPPPLPSGPSRAVALDEPARPDRGLPNGPSGRAPPLRPSLVGGGRIEGAKPMPSGAERGLTAGLPPDALPIPARSRAGIGALARRGLSGRQSSPEGSSAPACPLPALRATRGRVGACRPLGGGAGMGCGPLTVGGGGVRAGDEPRLCQEPGPRSRAVFP